MRSIRLTIGLALGVLPALVLAACGGSTASGTGSSASPTPTPLLHTASIKVGDKMETVLKNASELTLYYFKPDTATKIACTGACASNWPGQLTVFNGPNGNQVLYNGHPLYSFSKDTAAADANGQGVGAKWFVATPDLAAMSAAASESAPAY